MEARSHSASQHLGGRQHSLTVSLLSLILLRLLVRLHDAGCPIHLLISRLCLHWMGSGILGYLARLRSVQGLPSELFPVFLNTLSYSTRTRSSCPKLKLNNEQPLSEVRGEA